MRMKRALILMVIVFSVGLCLTGCKNYKKQIEGVWVVTEAYHKSFDDEITPIEQFENIIVIPNTMFTFSDSDICRIEYGSEGYTYSYKMNKDELIISSADNVSFNYTSSDDKLILEKVLAMQQKLGGINGGIQESLVHIELEKES